MNTNSSNDNSSTQSVQSSQNTQSAQSSQSVQEWVDFRKVNFEELEYSTNHTNNASYIIGTITLGNKLLTVQTPWLRCNTGYTIMDSKFGKTHLLQCSTLPVQEGSDKNTQMTGEFKNFIENMDSKLLEIVKSNWNKWTGEAEEAPNDYVLKDYQTSVLQDENPPYPESFRFKITKEMLDTSGNFVGGVFEQSYDHDAGKLGREVKQSNLNNLRKHARTRIQLMLKSFYVSVTNSNTPLGMQKTVRFGANWMVQKVLFYNVLSTMADETTLKTFSFGDIEVEETFSPNHKEPVTLQVEVIESGKRKMTEVSGDSHKKVKSVL